MKKQERIIVYMKSEAFLLVVAFVTFPFFNLPSTVSLLIPIIYRIFCCCYKHFVYRRCYTNHLDSVGISAFLLFIPRLCIQNSWKMFRFLIEFSILCTYSEPTMKTTEIRSVWWKEETENKLIAEEWFTR